MKSILFTGANSFICINFIKKFIKDYKYYCVGHKSKIRGIRSDNNLKIFYSDLSKRNSFNNFPKNIDAIVHLAGVAEAFTKKKMKRSNFF